MIKIGQDIALHEALS